LQRSLEDQVAARTATLNAALEDLKQTQVKLVQSEKMSALGQLVAGIAHEINNPINFIHGNLKPARDYITDLLELVELICHHCPTLPPPVLDQMEAIDLDFIRDDLPRLLQSMDVGTQRIRDLVLSLRNFSRLDQSETKAVDLHEGLESTLLILHNRYKATASGPGITIQKQYGELPLVECYPSQVNQVFMNLLGNAIDALDQAPSSPDQSPQIQIQTQTLGSDRVQIKITDNGPGIPTAIQAKIFDAFFTTKPISQGTGLGLSISHQIIVDKHRGQLYCDSSPHEGTTFTIELPVRIAASPPH
jgi:signal transduction histidine kinase